MPDIKTPPPWKKAKNDFLDLRTLYCYIDAMIEGTYDADRKNLIGAIKKSTVGEIESSRLEALANSTAGYGEHLRAIMGSDESISKDVGYRGETATLIFYNDNDRYVMELVYRSKQKGQEIGSLKEMLDAKFSSQHWKSEIAGESITYTSTANSITQKVDYKLHDKGIRLSYQLSSENPISLKQMAQGLKIAHAKFNVMSSLLSAESK